MKSLHLLPQLTLAVSAQASVVVTNSSQNGLYSVSSTDLPQRPGTTHANLDPSGNAIGDTDAFITRSDDGASGGVGVLTDGLFGAAGSAPLSDFPGIGGQASGLVTITYPLTPAWPRGGNVSAINLYVGWGDPGREDVNSPYPLHRRGPRCLSHAG